MTHVSLTTREDVESLCDDAAATGDANLLRNVAVMIPRCVERLTLKRAVTSRARAIENRLAGTIYAAQAYEAASEREIALLPETLSTPINLDVDTTKIQPKP